MLDGSTLKIMLLDDEPIMLNLHARILKNQGFTDVICYESGQAALDGFESANGHPNLILMDLNMPEMDGIEFVRHLVDRKYVGSLILISGEDERMLQATEKLVQAHQIVVLGHLRKPVSPQAVATLLAKWVPATGSKKRAAATMYCADEVRAAIANGELVNYYQPKVEVESGRFVGVETLVRWRHPKVGMIFPDQFIAVAEANDLIDDLTRSVLAAALKQAKEWHNAGLELKVAVNISVDNLASLSFADYVVGLSLDSGVQPRNVILEVTESRLMADLRSPLEILTRLRLKRFKLSIDDFGTGHSSLVQLRDIPFDELKIDRSFVHGVGSDETLQAIFNSSLGLAQQLGMDVVAEGVEDIADWQFLKQSGCKLAQGYFIGRPMPASELPTWINAWKARVLDGF